MKVKNTLLSALLLLTSVTLRSQTIPAARTVNWHSAGLSGPVPAYTNSISIVSFGGVGDGITINNTALQNAIVSFGGNAGVIYFPKGIFKFTTNIDLADSIILRGAASDSTQLRFDMGGILNNCLNIHGTQLSSVYRFTASSQKDSSKITIDFTGGLSAGDYIKIYQNDSSIIASSWAYGTVGQIVKIQSINGNTLTLASALRKDYLLSDSCKIVKLLPIKGVGIECLKITRSDATTGQTQNIDFDTQNSAASF